MSTLALLLWPVVILILFRRLPIGLAISLSIVGGYLLLPTGVAIVFEGFLDFDKTSVTALPALILAALYVSQRDKVGAAPATMEVLPGWLPRNGLLVVLLLMLTCGVFLTALTNTEPLRYGTRMLQAMTPFDGVSALISTVIALVPFILGRKFLARPDDHRNLLIIFCISGLLYSLPALFEVRMSPRINVMVYGFFPHEWVQHKRGAGWRPIVFLQHGLWLAIFFACATIAAAALIRVLSGTMRNRAILAAGWLLLTLILAKSLGAIMITLLILPVVFLPTRTHMLFAACIAGSVLTYPMLRGAGLVPINPIMNIASAIDEDRAGSFLTRLENEEDLLDKANRKPLFGWGTWGRARIFDKKGNNESLTDGYWIILMGEGGWIQYIATFGLLTLPVIIMTMRAKAYEITLVTSALCLILTANLIDLIPNATLTPLTWLMAGALAGRLELRGADLKNTADELIPVMQSGPRYSRFARHKGRSTVS